VLSTEQLPAEEKAIKKEKAGKKKPDESDAAPETSEDNKDETAAPGNPA
jgi:hypothetical protein